MITLSNVTLERGGRTLFERLSLTVHAGQRVGVVGRNGVGKSTLFMLLRAGLSPTAGEVRVPEDWRIAFLAQEQPASSRCALDWVLDGDTELRRVQHDIDAARHGGDDQALAALYGRFDDLGGYSAEARAASILDGLGFDAEQFGRAYRHFSGGWRIRLNLARTLMAPSELLLLDEPTNHLDLDALLWLESWLARYPGTVMTIAHDRAFLDASATHIAHLEHGQARLYRGGYSSFERQRAARLAWQHAQHGKQQRQIRHIRRFVERFRAKASKARLVQSRIKALERLQSAAPAYGDSPYVFSFPNPRKLSDPLLALDEARLGYGAATVIDAATLRIHPGSRIGILGANGAGKTTLVRTLAGELPLIAGEITRGEHSSSGYFAQHQLEQLDDEASAITHLERIDRAIGGEARPQQRRDFLGGWGFPGDLATRPAGTLSGGEKARLVLALLAWRRPAMLLLDEPTNHLDIEMRQALSMALQSYEGALIIVAHDRELLAGSVDEYWLIAEGRLSSYDGDIDDYLARLRAGLATPRRGRDAEPGKSKKSLRRSAAERRRSTRPLREAIDRLEREIERFAGAIKTLEASLADGELYRSLSSAELSEMLTERGRLERKLETLERCWLEKQQALEAAEGQRAAE